MSRILLTSFLFVSFFTVSVKGQQTAANLFIDFAKEQLESSGQIEEFEHIMGPNWTHQITLHTAAWSDIDAQHFLEVLKESEVEPQHILKILQAVSYLQALQTLSFQFVEGNGFAPAEDIFVKFIIEQLESSGQIEEFEDIMGSDWIDQITLHTAEWSDTDAQHFLEILKESKVEPQHILKILQATSYLQTLKASRLHFEFQATEEVADRNGSQPTEVEVPEQLRFSEFAFLNGTLTHEDTGYLILIQFINAAREHLGASHFNRIMGSSWNQSKWEERLTKYMKNEGSWTEQNARDFLLFLVKRIGLESALKIIKKNASYFEQIAYLDFKEKVLFYEGILGEEVVSASLRKSLGGFVKKNNLSGIRAIHSFIHKYIEGEEELREYIKKQIINIARATYSDLIGVEAFLFEYDFTRNDIKALMQEGFSGFALATPQKLRLVAEFLTEERIEVDGLVVFDWEGEDFTKKEVKALMQESFSGFALAMPKKLQAVAEFLINEYDFTKATVKTLMKESFRGFASGTPKKLRAVAEFLMEGRIEVDGLVVFDWEGENFTKEEVKALMQEGFQGFALATPKKLRAVAEFLINEYDFKKADVKALMQEGFQSFAFATPEKLRAVAEFLINEYDFEKADVKALMQEESFTGFARATSEKLRAVAEFLTEGKIEVVGLVVFDWEGENFTKKKVKALMQESFTGFTRAIPEKLRAVAEFLINEYDFTKADVKTLMQKSFQGFASSTPEKLRAVAEFLINEYDLKKSDVKTLMQKSFTGFASATPEKLRAVAKFLTEGRIEVDGLVVFDWEGENFTKKEVKALMKESFSGFASGIPEQLRAVAEFLIKEYDLKKSDVKTLMQESFDGFTRATPEKLRAVAEFLIKEYDFTKADVKTLMKESFRGFANGTPEKLRAVAEFLIKEYDFTKADVKTLMKESFRGFANGTPEKLQAVAEFLTEGRIEVDGLVVFDWEGENFTKNEVKTLMQESFKGFALATPEKLRAVAGFLTKGRIEVDGLVVFDWEGENFTKKEVKTLMQKSFKGFASSTPEKLRAVAEFLVEGRIEADGPVVFDWESENFTKEEVKTLMQESFQGFTRATPEKLRAVAEFLINEYDFEKADVKALMQESFQGFASSTPEKLRAVVEFLVEGRIEVDGPVVFDWEGENFTKKEVKILMQESFSGFALATPEKLQAVAEFLINEYDLKKSDVKILMQKSFKGFALAIPKKLRAVAGFLINEYDFTKADVKTLMQGSFQAFARATPKNLRSVAEFLKEYDFTKADVKALMQESFSGFTRGTPEKLRAVAEFLTEGRIEVDGLVVFDWEGENFTKKEVKALMQKSFDGFTRATPENLRAVAGFLIKEYDFTKADVKILMQKNFDGFTRATPENLRAVAEFLINEYDFEKADVKTLMQESFTGFTRGNPKVLKKILESGISIYMKKEEIKKKIQHNIQAFLDIKFNELTLLITSMQQEMNMLSTTQKQEWEIRLKQTLSDHLLKEDLIGRLQRLKNEMPSFRPDGPCQSALHE